MPFRLLIALPAIFVPSIQAPAEDLLQPRTLYSGPDGPISIVLSLRGRSDIPEGGFQLLLLDGEGVVLDATEAMVPGRFDLLEVLPAVASLTRAARVQVIDGGEAVGTPLVVEPLRTPVKVRSVRDVRPDGKSGYTRVIGFDDEVLKEEDAERFNALKDAEEWDATEPAITSGFRTYADRDVVLHTDHGKVRIALAPEFAPNTAWNFRHLVEGGFYNATTVHRVVHFDRNGNRFVIQGGDPSRTGDGSAGWDLPMERSRLAHDLGVISMARADSPHSAGSQFFICLGREGTARLDGQYVAFGWATSGEKPIARMADVEIADAATGRPVRPPLIERAELVQAPPHDPGVPRRDARIARWWTPETNDAPSRRDR